MKHVKPATTRPVPAISLEGMGELIDVARMFLAFLEELNMVLGIPIPMKGR